MADSLLPLWAFEWLKTAAMDELKHRVGSMSVEESLAPG